MKRIKITEREEIAQRLKEDGVAHTNMGIFEVKIKASRNIRNFQTKNIMRLPEKKRVHFRWSEWLSRVI